MIRKGDQQLFVTVLGILQAFENVHITYKETMELINANVPEEHPVFELLVNAINAMQHEREITKKREKDA